MTALTYDRNTPEKEGVYRVLPVAANTLIYTGALVVLNTDGFAMPGTSGPDLVAVGRAERRVENATDEPGTVSVRVKRGVFAYTNDGTVTAAHIGKECCVRDDQTVCAPGAEGRSIAGTVFDLEEGQVWVEIG
jgi:hypothetical protein